MSSEHKFLSVAIICLTFALLLAIKGCTDYNVADITNYYQTGYCDYNGEDWYDCGGSGCDKCVQGTAVE